MVFEVITGFSCLRELMCLWEGTVDFWMEILDSRLFVFETADYLGAEETDGVGLASVWAPLVYIEPKGPLRSSSICCIDFWK